MGLRETDKTPAVNKTPAGRETVLSVRELSVAFGFGRDARDSKPLQVTDRVSFDIGAGEFFALVGESGCGKSVTAMGILRLLPSPSARITCGEVLFAGENLAKLPLAALQKIRGSQITCIFQEPMQALNPVLRIRDQLLEVYKFGAKTYLDSCAAREPHAAKDPRAFANDEIHRMLKMAGFTEPERVLDAYPHELSGGMLQRICIVMALLPHPRLIIADEPTTALDVTVQAQVLAILKKMAGETGTAVLLITHNMGIVSEYAQRVAVMYAGRIIEMGGVRDVIDNPLHPYTRGLLAAIPESHADMKNLRSIPGSVPHPRDFAVGCRFADRCEECVCGDPSLQAKCRSAELPPCKTVASQSGETHTACCFK
ncbi:MAG: ABC transporter ATP-binding protein [Fibrobacter sp.]|nr:ABC transporter ATP-binding protein [Fibrobacter sp.]